MLRAGDAAATHATRVAIRRLRSTIRTFSVAFERGPSRHLDIELRWYAGLLGEVRDRQVLRARLDGVLDGWGDAAAAKRLRFGLLNRLDIETAAHWLTVQYAMAGPRHAALVDSVGSLEPRPVPETELAHGVDAARSEVIRRLEVAAADGAGGDVALLHDARKAAKRARYAAEAAAPVLGRQQAHEQEKLFERLQEILGEHHDAVVAEEYVAGIAREEPVADLDLLGLHLAAAAEELRLASLAEARELGLMPR